jgi:hypothetical protein
MLLYQQVLKHVQNYNETKKEQAPKKQNPKVIKATNRET